MRVDDPVDGVYLATPVARGSAPSQGKIKEPIWNVKDKRTKTQLREYINLKTVTNTEEMFGSKHTKFRYFVSYGITLYEMQDRIW